MATVIGPGPSIGFSPVTSTPEANAGAASSQTVLLAPHEWVVFGGFAAMLIGLALFQPRLAMLTGGLVVAAVLLQHPTFFGVGSGGLFGG